MTEDTYKRIEVAPGRYQCGCYWERAEKAGDVLRQCRLHAQASQARLAKFERETAKPRNSS